MCNANKQLTLSSDTLLKIFWLYHQNTLISHTSDITISGASNTTGSTILTFLSLSRVRTSQAGTYTCVVNMTIPGVVVDHQVARSVTLTVLCELSCIKV